MKKVSTRNLNTQALVQMLEQIEDEYGGIETYIKHTAKIWVKMEPVIEIRSLFSDGLNGIVSFDKAFYKITMIDNPQIKLGDMIVIQESTFKILKKIRLFTNNMIIFITQEQ
ncbi:phage head completion protein [Rickettsiales endosymbiont of Stachyamoeba lipophora]|uniref:phage head completion protein n=1 Tax=Rickettsiales endosymbiont of Stachyamoeba lipophora TaxID=2486578 RepID=UPI000F656185|nr:hypothetical protein [Rickettsiales endosymbiont of Stachyamoeba lipophora]AZL15548.1 hypothetical protein EF513_03145 [Rickettsiales endosymbiont of Stachyamoeba lipophora]